MSACSPVRHSGTPADIYSFDHPVGFYQKMQLVSGLRRLLERNQISLRECSRIADLGCGNGLMLRSIAELRRGNQGLVGIDLASDQLHAARRLGDSIRYVRADMRQLPLTGQSCDLVTAFVSFMFLATAKDVHQTARDIFRILNTHGHLIVFDLVRGRKSQNGARSLPASEIAVQVERAGFRLLDRQTCFKNVFGLKRLCTAYLPARLPISLVLLLEHVPFSPANNVFLLFQKA